MMANPETRERAEKIGKQVITERLPFDCPHCKTKLFGHERRCPECHGSVTAPDRVRVVYDAWPLKRLSVRGIITRTQFNAGDKYHEHWVGGDLVHMGVIDMARVGGSSDQTYRLLPGSLQQAEHRKLFRVGYQALLINGKGTVFLDYTNAIVLYEQEPQAVGRRLTNRTASDYAGAVAIEFLKVGLGLLADAYNLGR